MRDAERFWLRVDKNGPITPTGGTPCWRWTRVSDRNHYGKLLWQGRIESAHRISWEIHNGRPSAAAMVLHKCDNPSCVRPDHLFLGTQQDNVLDMIRKGRAPKTKPGLRGAHNGSSKLTAEGVVNARQRFADNNARGIAQLAREFGVSKPTMKAALTGSTWSWLPGAVLERPAVVHGTGSGYGYHKCRCALCRAYKRKNMARRRQREA